MEKMNERLKKYIKIVEVANPGHKTKVWHVVDKKIEFLLGVVKWYGGWRKYVFYTEAGYMDADFLKMIGAFCEERTQEHYGKI